VTRSVALGVLMCVTLTCLGVALADDPPLPPTPDQWIAPVADDVDVPYFSWVPEQMARWVVWPSDEYIAERQPQRDRSQPPPPGRQFKVPPGPESPSSARSYARTWIDIVLKPEWIPPDLTDRLILLQEDDPSRSSVICRYEINGTGIQIVQRKWALCVVVRPAPELVKGVHPVLLDQALMRALFRNGDFMARCPATWRQGLSPGIAVGGHSPEADGPRWWEWSVCHTDGKSVALYFGKSSVDIQPLSVPGDPWF